MSLIKHLYHYTTAEGLIGILSSRSLWATHVFFLNDSMEFRWGLNVAMSYLEKVAEQSQSSEQARRWLWLRKEVSIIGLNSIKAAYAASLSRKRDSLSQWRAYCPAGGYAIGFPEDSLIRIAEARGFEFVECVYNSEEQERLIAESVQQIASTWVHDGREEPWKRQEGNRFSVANKLNWELYRLAPRLKNSAFAEEEEVRLLSKPELRIPNEEFRNKNSIVVPYVPVLLGDDQDIWRQIDVIAGPTPQPELAKTGAERLVRFHTGCLLCVDNSSVPYRVW